MSNHKTHTTRCVLQQPKLREDATCAGTHAQARSNEHSSAACASAPAVRDGGDGQVRTSTPRAFDANTLESWLPRPESGHQLQFLSGIVDNPPGDFRGKMPRINCEDDAESVSTSQASAGHMRAEDESASLSSLRTSSSSHATVNPASHALGSVRSLHGCDDKYMIHTLSTPARQRISTPVPDCCVRMYDMHLVDEAGGAGVSEAALSASRRTPHRELRLIFREHK